jgi:hypothetical protein
MGQPQQSLEQLAAMERHRDRRSLSERLFTDFLREWMSGHRAEALRLLRDLETRMPRSLLVTHDESPFSVANCSDSLRFLLD